MTGLMKTVAAILFGLAPGGVGDGSLLVRHRVDLIELNHFVDEEGREVFRQVIFYDWSKSDRRYHVRAWRLIKKSSQLPQRRWSPKEFQCTWADDGLTRQVWAPTMRETWTQRDPERMNRKILPEDQRVPLWNSRLTRDPNHTDGVVPDTSTR